MAWYDKGHLVYEHATSIPGCVQPRLHLLPTQVSFLLEFPKHGGVCVQFMVSNILGLTNDHATSLTPDDILRALECVHKLLPRELWGARVTRLDLAVDFQGFDGDAENQSFIHRLRRLRFPGARKASRQPFEGTAYIGQRRSALMERIYLKSKEMWDHESPGCLIPPDLVRCELQVNSHGVRRLTNVLEKGTDFYVRVGGRIRGLRLGYQRLHLFQFLTLASLRPIVSGSVSAARGHRELLERCYPGMLQGIARLMLSASGCARAA